MRPLRGRAVTLKWQQATKNLTLEGADKAAETLNSSIIIDNFEFSGAQVSDANGAGIRYEGGNLTLNGCYFHNNEDGLLGGTWPTGTLTVNNSEFAFNGRGDGQTHNFYIGAIANLTIDNS